MNNNDTDVKKSHELKYFNKVEFGPRPEMVGARLKLTLDSLRASAGVPIYLHETFATTGHAPNSYHYSTPSRLCSAADFHFAPGLEPFDEFLLILNFPQIKGIGFYPNWSPRPGWHIDLRGTDRILWCKPTKSYNYDPLVFSKLLKDR